MSIAPFLARRARRMNWLLLAALGLAAFLLWPLLKTGFLCDDLFVSLIRGDLTCRHQTLFEGIAGDTARWLKAGRFFPLIFLLSHGTLYLLTDLLLYKSYVLVLVLSNLALFTCLLRRLTPGSAFPAYTALLVAAAFQFRIYADPILGFNGLMQWILMGTLLSLLTLHEHLRSGRRLWLLPSVLAYLLTLLAYEATYPFLALHVALVFGWEGGWRRTARKLWPFAAALAACATLSLTVRLLAVDPLSAKYQPNLDPVAYLRTLGRQLFAALPLSYVLVDPHRLFPAEVLRHQWKLLLTAWGVGFAVALTILSRLANCGPVRYRLLVPLGLLLWVLPALLIALSTGYQQEIILGVGYLPVYIEYYGIGLLGACGGTFVLARLASAPRARAVAVAGLALVFASVSSLTYCANQQVTVFLARPYHDDRLNVEMALRAGLIDDLPERTLLILDHEYHWWHGPEGSVHFYAQHTGKVLHTVLRSRLASLPQESAYELKDCCLDEHSGSVLVSKVTPAPAGDPRWTDRLTTRDVRVFVRDNSDTNAAAPFWLAGFYDGAEGEPGRFFIPREELRPVAGGQGWNLYTFQTTGRAVLTDSLEVVRKREPAELIWGSGFYPAVHQGGRCWRWCGAAGVMYLSNDTSHPLTVRVGFTLLGMEDVALTVKGDRFEEVIEVKKSGTAFSRVVRLDPGVHAVRFTANGPDPAACADAGALTFSVLDPVLRQETQEGAGSP